MDKLNNNKATPTKTRTRGDAGSDNNFRNDTHLDTEIDQPDPSIATPSIPQEMPAREIR